MQFDQLPRVPRTSPDDPENLTPTPFAGRGADGTWFPGGFPVEFLQEHFGQYDTAAQMKAATESEGLRRYFDWLAEQGYIPAK